MELRVLGIWKWILNVVNLLEIDRKQVLVRWGLPISAFLWKSQGQRWRSTWWHPWWHLWSALFLFYSKLSYFSLYKDTVVNKKQEVFYWSPQELWFCLGKAIRCCSQGGSSTRSRRTRQINVRQTANGHNHNIAQQKFIRSGYFYVLRETCLAWPIYPLWPTWWVQNKNVRNSQNLYLRPSLLLCQGIS